MISFPNKMVEDERDKRDDGKLGDDMVVDDVGDGMREGSTKKERMKYLRT